MLLQAVSLCFFIKAVIASRADDGNTSLSLGNAQDRLAFGTFEIAVGLAILPFVFLKLKT